ncbi:hypothetical protein L5515_002244 [Caenorhabditis briggsae]|uniref:Uncharacterized protein n=4 Tax=Caenorhabditis briggsae TaxID=6238 RepID=A0AAE9E3L0_CAEBR|nr:hypothetical protein L5515_002244 [Caenorhabditis briggsae]
MSSQPQPRQRIVPFTPYEWKYVRQLFRSRRVSDVKECVVIMSTWMSRCNEHTPVAISCSHVLLQAVYADLLAEEMPDSEKYMAIENLRSKHGYAIVRFVNYVNELGQTGAALKTMVDAVSKFGIPKKIVDIRHAITHQNLPDISQLRYATNFGLNWLWNNFWQHDARIAMSSEISSKGSPSEFSNQRGREQQNLQSIRAYSTWRQKNTNLNTELELSEVDEIFAIKKNILMDVTIFLNCFVKDGNLIQTPGQWKNWKLPPTNSDEKWQIPEAIQMFWEPILHLVFSLKISSDIIIAFLWRLREQKIQKSSKDQVMSWVRMLVMHFSDQDVMTADDWSRILDHLLPVAKHFNTEFIDVVMRNCPNLSRKRRLQVHRILDISFDKPGTSTPSKSASSEVNNSTTTPSRNGGIHTVNDLQQLLKSRTKSSTSSEVSAASQRNEATGIELCDAEDWVDVPFGMAPGQRVETFTVVVDESSDNSRKRKAFDAAIILDDED